MSSSASSSVISVRSTALLEFREVGAAVDLEHAAGAGEDHHRVRLVVLVVDFADDRLDHVLERHQAVDAAELVDHHGHVNAGGAHRQKQVGREHGGRYVERLALHSRQGRGLGRRTLAGGGEQLEQVLQVRDAHRIVQSLAIDRQAGVFAIDEGGDHRREARRQLDGDDIRPRRHHVLDGEALEGAGLIHEIGG